MTPKSTADLYRKRADLDSQIAEAWEEHERPTVTIRGVEVRLEPAPVEHGRAEVRVRIKQ